MQEQENKGDNTKPDQKLEEKNNRGLIMDSETSNTDGVLDAPSAINTPGLESYQSVNVPVM